MTKIIRNSRQSERENSIPSLMLAAVAICGAVFFAWIITGSNKHQDHQSSARPDSLAPISLEQQGTPMELASPPPETEPIPVQLQADMPQGDFYRFTDREGVIHMVNDPDKIPPEYRKKVSVTKAASSETPVRVTVQGHVQVPVTLSYRGKSVKTILMLDTGASTTIISEATAAELGIRPEETTQRVATLADGSKVLSHVVVIDSVRVGLKELQQTPVAILPSAGRQENHSGLLGMSFLKAFRYQVDLNGQKIIWR
jgi:clan AA aspartic protease (TIGR02281 family)